MLWLTKFSWLPQFVHTKQNSKYFVVERDDTVGTCHFIGIFHNIFTVHLLHLFFFSAIQIPEFDNLYLDMNGIIHQCSHPNDEDVHFRISEEKIFADIFHYLEVLFRIIKPRKVFFMAVDGVAPRAKMNQQRGRRFR